MDYKDLLVLLLRKLYIIIITVTLCIAASAFISANYITPMYESTTKLIFKSEADNTKNDYNEALKAQKMIQTYKEIILSKTVASNIAQYLNSGLSEKDIIESMKVEIVSETEVIKVTVTSGSAQLSADIANAIPQAAKEPLEIMDVTDIMQIEKAAPASEPDPYMNRNIILAGLIGAVLSVMIIVASEALNNRVKSASDIREKLNMNLLAMLPTVKPNYKKKR